MAYFALFCVMIFVAPISCFQCSTEDTDEHIKRDIWFNWKWPSTNSDGNHRVIIPYTVLTGYRQLGSVVENLFVEVGKTLAKHTCIELKKRTDEKDYIEVYKGTGCVSTVGRRSGKQRISLGNNCDHYSVVAHEVLHAIGFIHEQNRPDRDQHVTVFFDNIKDAFKSQYKKTSTDDINSGEQPYDFQSIMHYGNTDFSKKPGLKAMEAKENPSMKLGGEILSSVDIMQLNIAHNCPQKANTLDDFEITVYTSSSFSAGTNAKVYIHMFETDEKSSGEIELTSTSAMFEKGSIDKFPMVLPNFHFISKINIRHNNGGLFAAWKLAKVEIHNKTRKKKNTFICDCWLNSPPNTQTIKSNEELNKPPV